WPFELRVQQDHINALGAAADVVVLTSDVVIAPTALDAAGNERPTGRRILALGVDTLEERVPHSYRIGASDRWPWQRNRAARRIEGTWREVAGLLLAPA